MRDEIAHNIAALVAEAGGTLEITNGKRHRKIFINGRLAAILPRDTKKYCGVGRAHINTMAQVRRALRGEGAR